MNNFAKVAASALIIIFFLLPQPDYWDLDQFKLDLQLTSQISYSMSFVGVFLLALLLD